jgi:C_GCAxxG_C_C family probable redox protein
MNRSEKALACHEKGFNCAQSVAAAFSDMTKMSEKEILAVSGCFGGGMGGTHEEVCGTLSGAMMILGILFPHAEENDPETKEKLYGIAGEFHNRFAAKFGGTVCKNLLEAKLPGAEKYAANCTGHSPNCSVLIATAVEMLEEILRENGVNC